MTSPRRAYAELFAAIGHPIREAIVRELESGPKSVGALAKKLPVSRAAVSKHLRLLKDAEVVTYQEEGVRNFYSLNPEVLSTMRKQIDRMWESALSRYALIANNIGDKSD